MLKPNKHKGQHWLISKKYLEKIVESARIKPGEIILEVGPGTGNLTQELLAAGANVIAVEKDINLVGELKLKIKNDPSAKLGAGKLKIIESDILKFDETAIKTPYKIAANIPYYITGPIIQKFLRSANPPAEMILMVQKEVAERMCAQPPRANYLSSLVQSFAETKILFKVSKENFWPKPQVDSVVVKLIPHQHCPIRRSPDVGISKLENKQLRGKKSEETDNYIEFLRMAFRQPRQTLANNLKRGGMVKEAIKQLLEGFNLSRNIRPQYLNVESLIKIFVISKI